jgi:hypothetical protein
MRTVEAGVLYLRLCLQLCSGVRAWHCPHAVGCTTRRTAVTKQWLPCGFTVSSMPAKVFSSAMALAWSEKPYT